MPLQEMMSLPNPVRFQALSGMDVYGITGRKAIPQENGVYLIRNGDQVVRRMILR